MRPRGRPIDLGLILLADTWADLSGIIEAIRDESTSGSGSANDRTVPGHPVASRMRGVRERVRVRVRVRGREKMLMPVPPDP